VIVTHNPAVWHRCDTVITLAVGGVVAITGRKAAAS